MATDKIKEKRKKFKLRQRRSRAGMVGTAERPRLSVHRSLNGLYLQLIDDQNMKTLFSVNSKKDLTKKSDAGERQAKIAQAYLLGKALAEKAVKGGISRIVFDRSGHKYHGRVRAAAEGTRDGGLNF